MTTLGEIESCSRRWALSAGHYPDLWNGRGYPPRVQLGALSGTVVHLALEVITRALVRAGCPSLHDPTVLQVMRDLGGYTKVVNDCIDRALSRLASSPRAQRVLEFAARSLRARVPELRTRAQTMLCRVRLSRVPARHADGNTPRARGPLTMGAFPEIELRAEEIGWKGKADLIALSSDACEITDFKTGAPDEGHGFQIQVYALLWSRDAELNPDRRRADRLLLAYDGGVIEIAAPTESELDELEILLRARRDAAHEAVSHHPPEARPDPKNCRYCGVRQLCDEYWTAETQRRMVQEGEDRRFGDVEVTVTGRHGPSSWDARVELSRDIPTGKSAVIRTSGDSRAQPWWTSPRPRRGAHHERRGPGAASSDHARYAERGLRRSVDMPVDCLGKSFSVQPSTRTRQPASKWRSGMDSFHVRRSTSPVLVAPARIARAARRTCTSCRRRNIVVATNKRNYTPASPRRTSTATAKCPTPARVYGHAGSSRNDT